MKLNKIASLMLAGLMAVSMLAGCQAGEPAPTPEEPTGESTIATYLTDAQNEDYDVQIAFTYDNGIEDVMNRAIELYGSAVNVNGITAAVEKYLDADEVVNDLNGFYGYKGKTNQTENSKAGTQTYVYVNKVQNRKTVEAVANEIVDGWDVALNALTTEATIGKPEVDCTYTYAGQAAMVSIEDGDNVNRYVVVVVTCTTATTLAD